MSVGSIQGNVINISITALNVDLPSIPAASTLEHSVSIPNVRLGDFVCASTQLISGIVIGSCRVTSNGTVAISVANVTAGAIDPTSQQFRFLVARPESGNNVRFGVFD